MDTTILLITGDAMKPTFTSSTGVAVIGRAGIKAHMLAVSANYLFWVRDDGQQYHASIKNGRVYIYQ